MTARTRFYPVADKTLGHAINRVYRILKWDTARLRRELLTLEMRRALYDKVAEVVTASIPSGRPGDLTVHLPVGIVPGGWSLSREHDLPPHPRPMRSPSSIGRAGLVAAAAELAEEAGAEVLDLQEAGALDGRLVDAERPHDAQRRGALERADEAGVAVEEIRLACPGLHLAGVQEEAARVRVPRPSEGDRRAEQPGGRDRGRP